MSSTTSTGFANLGSVRVDQNTGRATIGGTLFGIDANKLANDLADVKALPIRAIDAKISKNATKVTALNGLKTLLQDLKDAASALRNPTMSQGGGDVFRKKNASLITTTGTTPAASLLSVTPLGDAQNGSFMVKINRTAKNDLISSSTTFASATATPITTPGNLVINGKTIAVTNATTLTELRDSINATTDIGVTANLIQISATSYTMSLTASNTGKAIDLTGSDASILTDLSIAASGATDTSLSAEIQYNGTTLVRPKNTIEDVVTGVRLNLVGADSGSEVTVSLSTNTTAIKDAIVKFKDRYNAINTFVKQQRAANADGTIADTSVLYGETSLRDLSTQLKQMVTSVVSGVTGINSLRGSGLGFSADGSLTFVSTTGTTSGQPTTDDTDFTNIINNNSAELANFYSFKSTLSSPNIVVLNRPTELGSLAGKTITLTVTATDSGGTATAASLSVDGQVIPSAINGGRIVAGDASILKGFSFGYAGSVINTGDPAFTATIKNTQGVADRIAGLTDVYLETKGILDGAIANVQDNTAVLNRKIDKINTTTEAYRARLLKQFQYAQDSYTKFSAFKSSLDAFSRSQNSGN
ncbi:MAG: flagellar filament capping protein FliD [Holosporales bacterium]